MSKVTKTICDKCNKELEVDEWYYSGDIVEMANTCDKGRLVIQGDYCKKCFKETIKEEL